MMGEVVITATLKRNDPRLAVYLIVPYESIAGWDLKGTTVVEVAVGSRKAGSLNADQHDAGRRTIKRCGSAPGADWFIELPGPFCKKAGIAEGERVEVTIGPATADLPAELERLINADPALRAAWDRAKDSFRRPMVEHVMAAKQQVTRERRAAAVVDRLLRFHMDEEAR